jgi:hypothetical protein
VQLQQCSLGDQYEAVAASFCPYSYKDCSTSNPGACAAPIGAVLGLASLFAYVVLSRKEKVTARTDELRDLMQTAAFQKLQLEDEVLKSNPSMGLQHQRALARSRQTAHLNKALTYLKSGERALAYTELCR